MITSFRNVCAMKENRVKCLNPWDPQSKRQYMIDGVYRTLDAGQCQGGQAHGICYCIEGNTVDRISNKNGRGWCENVSPTLNTQDRHAICYGIDCRNGVLDKEKVATLQAKNGGGFSYNCTHPICISLEGNGARPSHLGKGFSEDGTMYTLNTIETHSVCYRKSCKPNSIGSLERWIEDDITNTLNCFEFGNDTRTPELIVQHKEKDERTDI